MLEMTNGMLWSEDAKKRAELFDSVTRWADVKALKNIATRIEDRLVEQGIDKYQAIQYVAFLITTE